MNNEKMVLCKTRYVESDMTSKSNLKTMPRSIQNTTISFTAQNMFQKCKPDWKTEMKASFWGLFRN